MVSKKSQTQLGQVSKRENVPVDPPIQGTRENDPAYRAKIQELVKTGSYAPAPASIDAPPAIMSQALTSVAYRLYRTLKLLRSGPTFLGAEIDAAVAEYEQLMGIDS